MTSTQQYSDLDWYLGESGRKKIPPRCPIAACDKCPRYYISLLHLDNGHLNLSDDQKLTLKNKWELSDAFVNEESTVQSTSGAKGNNYFNLLNFCPEVTGTSHGVFASNLANYIDSFDKKNAHKELREIGAAKNDIRWKWMWCDRKHYSECTEYSVYFRCGVTQKFSKDKKRQAISSSLRWSIFERDGFKCFYCGVRGGNEAELHIDHKISVDDGGTNNTDNLVTACAKCNGGKGKRSVR